MKYSFESRVRFSEIDDTGRLTLMGIVNYLQDCAVFHGQDCGVGIDWNDQNKKAWVVVSMQAEIQEYPAYGQRIIVSTWATGFRGMMGNREFSIKTPEGKILALAKSEWVFMDMKAGVPIHVTEEQTGAYGLHPELAIRKDFGKRKIRIPKKGGEVRTPFRVQEYQIDTNHHVNNGQYVRMALRNLPFGFETKRMRVEYKKQAFLGDMICPSVYHEGNDYIVTLCSESGEIYFSSEFSAGEVREA